MLQRFFLGAVALVLTSGVAFAGCEDGPNMAEDAALKAARAAATGCTRVELQEPKLVGSDEIYQASVKCSQKTLQCRVVLREVEDAVCYVKSKSCSAAKPTPGIQPVPNGCPAPGSVINCMPAAPTSAYCENRAWIKKHCPGVHFID